jgi:hydrogenase maturation protease
LTQDLGTALKAALAGRVCVVGVGNDDLGDDGFGVRLAEELLASGHEHVRVAGTTPENCLGQIEDGRFDTVLFLDAVDIGAEAGSAVLLDSASIQGKFPQISTHRISLGTLARLLERPGGPRVWLLGAQPSSLRFGSGLSRPLLTTLMILRDLLIQTLRIRTLPPRPAALAATTAGMGEEQE